MWPEACLPVWQREQEVEAVVSVVRAKVPETVSRIRRLDIVEGAQGAVIAFETDKANVEPPAQTLRKKRPPPGTSDFSICMARIPNSAPTVLAPATAPTPIITTMLLITCFSETQLSFRSSQQFVQEEL
jgi:hypothetical protein